MIKSSSLETVVEIAVISLVVLSLICGYFFFTKRKGNSFVFVGLSGSGKTALFTRLVHGTMRQTVTSQQANEAINFRGKYHLLDLPGHDKLYSITMDHLPLASGIVFVVDATQVLHR